MPSTATSAQTDVTAPQAHEVGHALADLEEAIHEAAHLLPSQGPIRVFVHHNTLHMLQHLPFDEALKTASRLYRCETYLSQERYRQELQSGRIRRDDLTAVLREDLGEAGNEPVCFGTRFDLRLAMIEHPLHLAPDAELRWLMAEANALRKFRDEVSIPERERMVAQTRHWVMRDLRNGQTGPIGELNQRIKQSLADLFDHYGGASIEYWSGTAWEEFTVHAIWIACQRGVQGVPPSVPNNPPRLRHREALHQATGDDPDVLVNDVLIRFCGAFLDQGVAGWTLPDRDRGFFQSFLRMYRRPNHAAARWLQPLARELKRLERAHLTPLESIDESLRILGVEDVERESFLAETLLALPGWAGMLWQMETNAEWTLRPAPHGTLTEYLAIRLILDRLALTSIAAQSLGFHGPLHELRHVAAAGRRTSTTLSPEQRAYLVFQLAQVLGWQPQNLFELDPAGWQRLVDEIEAFDDHERRRTLQFAYERRYCHQALDALAIHAARPSCRPESPLFQWITCIDDREESFRRHLEEVDPRVETFATAGFYASAMYYRGAGDAHFIPLCPVVIKPKHYVQEEVAFSFADSHERRARTRRAIGAASHWFHTGSRSFIGGVVTSIVGSLATFPLVARILFPRIAAQIRRRAGSMVQPPPVTQLHLERLEPTPGPEGGQLGFTVPEMADTVQTVLEDLALTSGLARLVVVTGHGSSSLNNPHESAYNCGACGGGRGGPNARAFAMMANDPRVRDLLRQRGLDLSPDVYFLGTFHNTCEDSITWYDLDRIPLSHRAVFEETRRIVDVARERNAHERCRRFESAPLSLTPEAALRHVEERAEDLSQARPEYNHATDALCVVGRRQRTRGLFMDHRAFLSSYDEALDDEQHTLLARQLAAVIPVCAGINLEYYFSTVDVIKLGSGSKLPYNIASLLGVMEGASSDLRTGLSQQMIEIHEPVRLLFVIECCPEAMLSIMDRNPLIGELCRNRWVFLAVLDPNSADIQVFDGQRFHPYQPETHELPTVASSLEWYRGWRDYLGFAEVTGGPVRPSGGAAPSSAG